MTTAQLHKFLAIKVMGWTTVLNPNWAPTTTLDQALMIFDRCLDMQPTICVNKIQSGKRVTYLVGSQKASTFPLAVCRFARELFKEEKPWKPTTKLHTFAPDTFGLCAKCDGAWDHKRHRRL